MGVGSVLRDRRQSVIAVVTALVVFGVILVLLIGRSSTGGGDNSLPPAGGTGASTAGQLPVAATLSLPAFATMSDAGIQAHAVTMVVTSDKPILALDFAVRGGDPASGQRSHMARTVVLHEVAHGDGIVAEIAAQAAAGSTEITCMTTVDGVVTTRMSKGAFAVVLCVA